MIAGVLRTVALAVLLAMAVPSQVGAQTVRPLQLEGVQGLDMRVLTRADARLLPQAGGSGGTLQPPFTHFYVFEKAAVAGKGWLRVGANRLRPPTGWIAEDQTVPWRQAVCLSFNLSTTRQPVLFFDQRPKLDALLTDPQRADRATALVRDAQANRTAPDSGVIALEPRPVHDIRTRFYLLPILDVAEVQVPGVRRRGGSKEVKVASLSLPLPNEAPEVSPQQALNEFKIGVVFVIDTTISMQKYINRTRKTVNNIVERIRRSAIRDQVTFGLVGFRDGLDGRPETADDYVTRVFHPLRPNFDPTTFAAALDGMKEASTSNPGFVEDGMAGVQAAMKMEGWDNYQGRYIVLITDAPLREAGDPRSSTKVSVEDAVAAANTPDRPTAIVPILLKTPEGAEHHAEAERQFGRLSLFRPINRPLMVPIPGGELDRYGQNIDQTVDDMVRMIEAARQGQAANTVPPAPGGASANILDAGYAMQLAWLGNRRNVGVPSIVEGWAADFDPADPAARPSFNIHVLLTRNQLNELYQALDSISRAATARVDTAGGSRSFVTQLRHILSTAQTDPATLQSLDPNLATRVPSPDEIRTLGDLVSGYVTHLPYRSALLTQPPQALDQASNQQIYELLTDIRSKRQMYRDFYQDRNRWTLLNPAAGFEEAVYPVPLELMP
ncbi:VWA domain-containing protein [Azospirillum sp. RWY-5-1]|uniref:VWA domain-containing protein n=1 Tax=Azospirillum oleiclasticum TaxID=2735135 RepID=A0ABX2T7X7_9PROT|nr:vWA domain-containing protein [Azospirillum oleiclasticum]NYZ12944.1 VWA domain-containing protein [Azospirillum oleiclasticum]NYZ20383.1 VWA domain-containing protein [Azospirillum oleiclasticum]